MEEIVEKEQKDTTYATAKVEEILAYVRGRDYTWDSWDGECLVISIDKKRGTGKTFKSVKKSQGSSLDEVLAYSNDRAKVMELWEKLNFPKRKGGGGGREALTREEYISQSEKMGFSNNAAGFVSFNAAKIFNITEGTKLNRNGDSVQAFETRDFSCSIDLQKREITLKLVSK